MAALDQPQLPREHVVGRRPPHYDANAAAAAGLLAGLAAGALLLTARVLLAVAAGRGPSQELADVAAIFLAPPALEPPLHAAATGVALAAHLGLASAFGLAFGLVAFGWQRATVIWAGVVWGCLVYAFMAFLALPVVSPSLARREIGFAPALLHVAFGVVIALSFEALRFRSGVTTAAPHRGATLTFRSQR
jgi:hypothetical protein